MYIYYKKGDFTMHRESSFTKRSKEEDSTKSVQPHATPGSMDPRKRIVGFDFARGISVFGMFLMNFKIVMGASEKGPRWLVFLTSFFEGHFGVMFIMLAGIGLTLLMKRAIENNDQELLRRNRKTLLKRALFLFVIGLLYYSLWPADILHYYGVYIAIGTLMLTTSNKKIWLGAISSVIMFMILSLLLDWETGWNWDSFSYTDFWTIKGFLRNLFFNGFTPVFPWVAFLLIGIWFGRLNIRDTALRTRVLIVAFIIAVTTEVVSRVLITMALPSVNPFLFSTEAFPPFPLFVVAAASEAIVLIILCINFTEKFSKNFLIKPIAYTGQMVLTNYVSHVVIGMGLLETLNMMSDQTLFFSIFYATSFFVFSVLISYFWRKKFNRGPLEYLMRRVSG